MNLNRTIATGALDLALALGPSLLLVGCSSGETDSGQQASIDKSEQKQLQDAMQRGFQKPLVKRTRNR